MANKMLTGMCLMPAHRDMDINIYVFHKSSTADLYCFLKHMYELNVAYLVSLKPKLQLPCDMFARSLRRISRHFRPDYFETHRGHRVNLNSDLHTYRKSAAQSPAGIGDRPASGRPPTVARRL